MLDSLHGIALGGIDLAESTSYFQSEGITVSCEREVPVQIDGELLGRFKNIEFRETSTRLRVLAPETPCQTPFMDAMKSLLQWPPKPEAATVAKTS